MVLRTRLSVTLYTHIACLVGYLVRISTILTHPFIFLLSFSIQVPGQQDYLQSVFDHLLSHPFQYICSLIIQPLNVIWFEMLTGSFNRQQINVYNLTRSPLYTRHSQHCISHHTSRPIINLLCVLLNLTRLISL
jgi:hypothetical protein